MIVRPMISEKFECRVVKNFESGDWSLPQETARHLPGDANELLLFGASKLKEISFKMQVTDRKTGIRLPVGTEFFFSPSPTGLGSTQPLFCRCQELFPSESSGPQRETYYLFYSNRLSRWFITLTHSTHHTYGTSYPDFVHRFLCKEKTRFWLLDLLPPSSEGVGRTYLVLTILSPLLIWGRDSALFNYLASDWERFFQANTVQ